MLAGTILSHMLLTVHRRVHACVLLCIHGDQARCLTFQIWEEAGGFPAGKMKRLVYLILEAVILNIQEITDNFENLMKMGDFTSRRTCIP